MKIDPDGCPAVPLEVSVAVAVVDVPDGPLLKTVLVSEVFAGGAVVDEFEMDDRDDDVMLSEDVMLELPTLDSGVADPETGGPTVNVDDNPDETALVAVPETGSEPVSVGPPVGPLVHVELENGKGGEVSAEVPGIVRLGPVWSGAVVVALSVVLEFSKVLGAVAVEPEVSVLETAPVDKTTDDGELVDSTVALVDSETVIPGACVPVGPTVEDEFDSWNGGVVAVALVLCSEDSVVTVSVEPLVDVAFADVSGTVVLTPGSTDDTVTDTPLSGLVEVEFASGDEEVGLSVLVVVSSPQVVRPGISEEAEPDVPPEGEVVTAVPKELGPVPSLPVGPTVEDEFENGKGAVVLDAVTEENPEDTEAVGPLGVKEEIPPVELAVDGTEVVTGPDSVEDSPPGEVELVSEVEGNALLDSVDKEPLALVVVSSGTEVVSDTVEALDGEPVGPVNGEDELVVWNGGTVVGACD